MKRIFLFLSFLLFFLQVHAQEIYVKFNRSIRLDSAGITTLAGEILPVTSDRKELVLWADSLKLPSGSYLFLSDTAVNDLSENKHDFVRQESAGMIRIDVSTLAPLADTAYLVCENGMKIPLFSKTSMLQSKVSCGNRFRLVIPGIPTMFYSDEELVQLIPPARITEAADSEPPVTENLFRLAERYMVELGVFLLVIVAAVLIFIFRKKIRRKFFGGRKNLPGSADRGSFYNRSKGDGKGIDAEEAETMSFPDLQEAGSLSGEGNLQAQFKQTLQFLHGMENRILKRIDSIQNGQSDIRTLNEKIDQANREKAAAEQLVEHIRRDKQHLQKDLDLIHSRVIQVDFLRNYCEAVAGVFDLCRVTVGKAYDQYRYKMDKSPENAEILGHFLLKFEYKKPSVVGKWEQVVQDIRNSGTTPNAELIRSFSQIGNEEEKIREFKRQIFDVLMEYASAVLVLAEELKNFSRFALNGYDGAHETESVFSGLVIELLNKLKTVKLEMRYVPLFVKNAKYSNLTKVVNQRPGRVYTAVIDKLDKDTVAEIVAFGFESEFGKTETQVILS